MGWRVTAPPRKPHSRLFLPHQSFPHCPLADGKEVLVTLGVEGAPLQNLLLSPRPCSTQEREGMHMTQEPWDTPRTGWRRDRHPETEWGLLTWPRLRLSLHG